MKESIHISLPDKYDLVVGDTFQLFFRGVIQAVNPYCFDIVATCEKGHSFPRYFEYTPQEAGQHKLVISVYSNDKRLLGEASTLLNVCGVCHSPAQTTNILCIGDSLTANGIWVNEVRRRLLSDGGYPKGNGLSNLRFIGTCKQDDACFEGYGGWTWESYLTGGVAYTSDVWITCNHNKTQDDQHSIWADENNCLWQLETIEKHALKLNRYQQHINPKPDCGVLRHLQNGKNTEAIVIEKSKYARINPFWDEENNKVDFLKYCLENQFDKIDIACIMLTWNGLGKDIDNDLARMVSRGKQFVDRLHEQFPSAKIKIMGLQAPSVNGGTGANYGAALPYCDRYGLTRLVFGLNSAYQAWTNESRYKDFAEFINISGQFDSEYNMPSAEKAVNTRSKRTEVIGTNGVHPTADGYLQIADAVYRSLINTLNI